MGNTANDMEKEWLLQLQQHNETALACLMEKYYDGLYAYAVRFARSEALAKDVVQEVFISLWENRKMAASILSLHFYLLKAVKNRMLKALHQKNRQAESISLTGQYDFDVEFSIESKIIAQQLSDENAQKIRAILAGMSARQKEIIFLKFYRQLSHEEIAGLMGISRQSAYNLLHESLQKVKTCWKQGNIGHAIRLLLLAMGLRVLS